MSKRVDITRQNLTVEQLNAIDLLVTGATDSEVANKVGRSRQTVLAWRTYHPTFIAELNRRRSEIWSSSLDGFRSLVGEAIEVLRQELRNPDNRDRAKAALALLRMAGLDFEGKPEGSLAKFMTEGMTSYEVVQSRARERAVINFDGLLSPVTSESVEQMTDQMEKQLEELENAEVPCTLAQSPRS